MKSLLCILGAAICKAISDTLLHHYDSSIFKGWDRHFWDPNVSWQYVKLIIGYRPDAWHLANSGMIVFFIVGAALHRPGKLAWYWEVLIAGTAFNLMFDLFYNLILR